MYTIYDSIFDDFPARNTVYTPYIYGSVKVTGWSQARNPTTQMLQCYFWYTAHELCVSSVAWTSSNKYLQRIHELISLYEQAYFLTEGLFCKPCISRSTTNLFMISFLSRTLDFFSFFLN